LAHGDLAILSCPIAAGAGANNPESPSAGLVGATARVPETAVEKSVNQAVRFIHEDLFLGLSRIKHRQAKARRGRRKGDGFGHGLSVLIRK
jgi:hypothetical protein